MNNQNNVVKEARKLLERRITQIDAEKRQIEAALSGLKRKPAGRPPKTPVA